MRFVQGIALLGVAAAVLTPAVLARAASPLAAIPVGSQLRYKVTTQTTGAQKSAAQSGSHTIIFRRQNETTIRVRLDGKAAGNLSVGSDGSVQAPQNLNPALAPFGELGTFMRAAPSPLATDNTWTAVLAVPVQNQTDNVSVTLKVTQLTEGTVTVTGSGNNTMDVPAPKGNGTKSADVSINVTMGYNSNHELTSASRTISAIVHMGANGKRDRQSGSTWTITPF